MIITRKLLETGPRASTRQLAKNAKNKLKPSIPLSAKYVTYVLWGTFGETIFSK